MKRFIALILTAFVSFGCFSETVHDYLLRNLGFTFSSNREDAEKIADDLGYSKWRTLHFTFLEPKDKNKKIVLDGHTVEAVTLEFTGNLIESIEIEVLSEVSTEDFPAFDGLEFNDIDIEENYTDTLIASLFSKYPNAKNIVTPANLITHILFDSKRRIEVGCAFLYSMELEEQKWICRRYKFIDHWVGM